MSEPPFASHVVISRPPIRLSAVLGWMILSWAVMILAGIVALSRPDALGANHPVSFSRSVFTSINAATGSGFSQQFAETEKFSPLVQSVLALETLAGLLLSLVGGGLVLRRVLRMEYRGNRIVLITAVFITVAAVAGLATVQSGEGTAHALLRGISALAGAGPAQQLQWWTEHTMQFVLTPLALLGSLGVTVIPALFRRDSTAARARSHFWNILAVVGGVYIVAVVLICLELLVAGTPMRSAVGAASGIALASHGWGVATDFASTWPRGVVWTAMAISILGVGTLGATPNLGFAWLITFPRRIWPTILRLLAVQASASLACLLVLLHTEPQLSAERILMLVISASAKTGLSHEPVSIAGPGLLTLAGVMAFSKILPLCLLRAVPRRDTL